ncbi:hypothetical protein ACTFIV_005187 [Dictyostelium citrinum]
MNQVPLDVKSEISNWLTLLTQWNGKDISLFPSYDYFLTTDASEAGAGATLKKGNKIIKSWSFQWSTTQSNMSSNRREMLPLLMANQALCRNLNNALVHEWSRWSNQRSISSLRTALEAVSQEESQLDWRAHSRILQCQSRQSRITSHPRQSRVTTENLRRKFRLNSDESVFNSPQHQLLKFMTPTTQGSFLFA